MSKFSRKDIISDLPQSIIETILTKLPIRDAVRTSILSSNWRYQWATMTQLVFDKESLCLPSNTEVAEKKLVNFITQCLLLHDGPIHKFKLSTSYLDECAEIHQWLLFLSRKDIKELVLRAVDLYLYIPTPSLIFSCQQLTSLTLCGFEVEPPSKFQGFPCLKYLKLDDAMVTLEVIENLISGCPLLESFKYLMNVKRLALTIRAPNLKHLTVKGNFNDIYLEYTPLLVAISIDFFPEGDIPNIVSKHPVTSDCLKFIKLTSINYEEMAEALSALHLLLQAPNVEELQISAAAMGGAYKLADLDMWESPTDFTFKHLKIVKMSNVSCKNDIKFLKFVLGRSPVLEVMRVSSAYDYRGKSNMANEVLHFQRASPKLDIKFSD